MAKDLSQIYVSDFETLTEKSTDYRLRGNKTAVFLFYFKNLLGNTDGLGFSLEDFFIWLENGESKTIYFHNLSFDGNFIMKHLLKNKKLRFLNTLENQIWLQTQKLKFPPRCWKIFHNGNKIYSIEIKYATKFKTWSVLIKCSLTILSASVAALAKDFNLAKQTWGDEYTPEEFYNLGGFNMEPKIKNLFIEYIKNDVEVVRLALLGFEQAIADLPYSTYQIWNKVTFKFEPRHLNIHKLLTVGAIVKKLSQNYLRSKLIVKEDNYEWKKIYSGYRIKYSEYELASKWKAGGFTQFNPNYLALPDTPGDDLISVKGVGIDINSSYPFQATKLMPYGPLVDTPIPESPKYTVLKYLHISVKSAVIKDKASAFITLKNWKKRDKLSGYRYEMALQNFECYYMEEEWELLKKSYDIEVDWIKTYYVKSADYFKEFTEHLYELKASTKQQGKNAISWGYKILLNTFYGKNTARVEYDDTVYITSQKFDLLKNSNTTQLSIGYKEYDITTFQNKFYLDNDILEDPQPAEAVGYKILKIKQIAKQYKNVTNVLIGSTIAAYGRIQLQQAVMDIGWDKFIYCDTDSIYAKATWQLIESKLEIDNYKLGAWGIDSEISAARIIGAKRYVFELTEHSVNKDKKFKYGYCGAQPDLNKPDEFIQYWEVGSEIFGAVLRRVEDEYGIILKRGVYKPTRGTN